MTDDFQSQCNPLSLNDFVAITSVLSEVPSLVFFNCGIESGASQKHKHIQVNWISYFQW